MPLLIVHVAPMPQPVAVAVSGGWSDMLGAARAQGAATLCRIVDDVCGGSPADLDVRALSMIGDPGRTLVELARPGDVLVVGRGHRGPLSRLITPSARRYCAKHTQTTLICFEPPSTDELTEILAETGEPVGSRRRLTGLWSELRSDRRWRIRQIGR
jgi:nucleotide-binding universal stress UspA family protein